MCKLYKAGSKYSLQNQWAASDVHGCWTAELFLDTTVPYHHYWSHYWSLQSFYSQVTFPYQLGRSAIYWNVHNPRLFRDCWTIPLSEEGMKGGKDWYVWAVIEPIMVSAHKSTVQIVRKLWGGKVEDGRSEEESLSYIRSIPIPTFSLLGRGGGSSLSFLLTC